MTLFCKRNLISYNGTVSADTDMAKMHVSHCGRVVEQIKKEATKLGAVDHSLCMTLFGINSRDILAPRRGHAQPHTVLHARARIHAYAPGGPTHSIIEGMRARAGQTPSVEKRYWTDFDLSVRMAAEYYHQRALLGGYSVRWFRLVVVDFGSS